MASKASKNEVVQEDSWRVEDDLRVLLQAEEIREDKKRMAAVRARAKEKLADIQKISTMSDVKPEPGDKD